MPLVPAAPLEGPGLATLRTLSVSDLFDGERIVSMDDANCVSAGLFLFFSDLDRSHRVSQHVPTASGSYWHGIMHRQEGDWSNAKYWFRRTGDHPVFGAIEQHTRGAWDPFAFVDECRSASSLANDPEDVAERQMIEWHLLMEHCHRLAVGR